MAKYLKIDVSSPFIGTNETKYLEVEDNFNPDDDAVDAQFADEMTQNAVWDYVSSGYEVVDEDEVPEEDRV